MKKFQILFLGLGLVFFSGLEVRAEGFADVPLSRNVKKLVTLHVKAYFPDGPSTEEEDEIHGLPNTFFNLDAPSVKKSFLKKVSPIEAIQAVLLKTGENVIFERSGQEYKHMGLRYVCEGAIPGSTDLEKAANAIEKLNQLGIFSHEWPWSDIPQTLRNPPNKGPVGYLIDEEDPLSPQVSVIRSGTLKGGTQSFIEVGFVQGPL